MAGLLVLVSVYTWWVVRGILNQAPSLSEPTQVVS